MVFTTGTEGASSSVPLLKYRRGDLSAVEQGSCYLPINIAGYLANAEDFWSAVTQQVSSALKVSPVTLNQGQTLFRVTLNLIQSKSMNLFNMHWLYTSIRNNILMNPHI